MRRALPTLLSIALIVAGLGGQAAASDRARLYLPRDLAAQRTMQLSPGSGLSPGYRQPRLIGPHRGAWVEFSGSVPTAIRLPDGARLPVGAFDDQRLRPDLPITKD